MASTADAAGTVARLQALAQKAGASAFWMAMYLLQFASWYYAREEQLTGQAG